MEYTENLWEKYETEADKKKKVKEKKENEKRWAVVSIASIPLVMTLGNSMLIPVLPTLEREVGISPFQSSMIITVYSVIAIIFIPLAGYLSDRWGRKNVIIPSLFLAAIGGVISAYSSWKAANPYWLILTGRALQGIGQPVLFHRFATGGGYVPIGKRGQYFPWHHRNSQHHRQSFKPILGSFWQVSFGFCHFLNPCFCLLSILLMIFLVKVQKRKNRCLSASFARNVENIQTEQPLAQRNIFHWRNINVPFIWHFVLLVKHVRNDLQNW